MSTIHWHTPEGYKVSSYCTSCGKDFSHDGLFDRHRIGTHEYTYSEGLKLDPPKVDGRRCKTEQEMMKSGMRMMTPEEMLGSRRHAHRVGFGIEMWFDPAELARMRENRA